ncbi:hypothetical protein [Pseudoduganella sp. R-34]|uniref:hypothetical protein n=1 Tax=Pseudoduganella sp. R-34 TaxID=3404062 RepID=UPI003CF280C8
MAIPWVKLKQGEEFPIDFFARGLPLPEYYENFVKISHPRTAYYRRHWLSQFWQDDGKIHTYLTNEMIYHGTAPRENFLPHVYDLVCQQKHIALEFDGLAYHPAFAPCSYTKGIYLKLENDKTVFLTEIIVHQEGSLPKEMGIPRGISSNTPPPASPIGLRPPGRRLEPRIRTQ